MKLCIIINQLPFYFWTVSSNNELRTMEACFLAELNIVLKNGFKESHYHDTTTFKECKIKWSFMNMYLVLSPTVLKSNLYYYEWIKSPLYIIKSPKSWRLLETTFLPSSSAFCLFSTIFSDLVQRSYY